MLSCVCLQKTGHTHLALSDGLNMFQSSCNPPQKSLRMIDTYQQFQTLNIGWSTWPTNTQHHVVRKQLWYVETISMNILVKFRKKHTLSSNKHAIRNQTCSGQSIINGLVLLGKLEPETHGFLPSNWSGFPLNIFPSSSSMTPTSGWW